MPNGDKTGPIGKGPKTGKGIGFCTRNTNLCFSKGQGLSRRLGRGMGRGFRFFNRNDSSKAITQNEIAEEDILLQKKQLEKKITDLNKKLEDLKKQN